MQLASEPTMVLMVAWTTGVVPVVLQDQWSPQPAPESTLCFPGYGVGTLLSSPGPDASDGDLFDDEGSEGGGGDLFDDAADDDLFGDVLDDEVPGGGGGGRAPRPVQQSWLTRVAEMQAGAGPEVEGEEDGAGEDLSKDEWVDEYRTHRGVLTAAPGGAAHTKEAGGQCAVRSVGAKIHT
jgi:hypothetical protein